jgi:phosphatidylserine decarboxylase
MNPAPPASASDPHANRAQAARRGVCRRTATLFLALVAGVLLGRGLPHLAGALGVLAAGWMLASLVNHFFFRDPNPATPRDADLLVAPAHGRVDVIEEVEEPEFLHGPARRISIFLSVLDVHVQNAPVAARVAWVRHRPGRFLNALRTDSAEQNEQVFIGLESLEHPGERLAVRQIAGAIARRIECWVREGDTVTRGQRLGLIRYGSRCDLYLPPTWSLRVSCGDRVVGGETVVAVRNATVPPPADEGASPAADHPENSTRSRL